MADPPIPSHPVRDKGKLVLIPILGGVLLWMMRSGDSAQHSVDTNSSTVTAVRPADGTRTPSAPSTSGTTSWPQLPIEEIVACNPFTYPSELITQVPKSDSVEALHSEVNHSILAEQDRRQRLLDEWQSAAQTAYYHSESGVVALIGSRVIREGDVIEGIIKVERLSPDGAVFSFANE